MEQGVSVDAAQGTIHEQMVVEVIDGGRSRKVMLVLLLVLLVILLLLAYFGFRSLAPAGAPLDDGSSKGMRWIRSIYAYGSTSDALLQAPVDAAIAPNGTIWTVSGKTALAAFKPSGAPLKFIPFKRGSGEGMVNSLEGMDVAENGEIFVCDFGNEKILVFDQNGVLLRSFVVPLPIELDVKDDRVAIATANGVAVTDLAGNHVAHWGTRGPDKDQFDMPHGITWGEDGNIYVSDTNNRRLKAYSRTGRLLWVYPKSREFASRKGLSSAHSTQTTASGLQLPAGMTVDAAGRVVLVDPFEFTTIHLDTSRQKIGETWGDFGHHDGYFAYPTGIAYDAKRDYYVVADTANNRLQVVSLDGSGGNPLLAAMNRALQGPWWLLMIPFALLALAAFALKRRSVQSLDEQTSVFDANGQKLNEVFA